MSLIRDEIKTTMKKKIVLETMRDLGLSSDQIGLFQTLMRMMRERGWGFHFETSGKTDPNGGAFIYTVKMWPTFDDGHGQGPREMTQEEWKRAIIECYEMLKEPKRVRRLSR